MFYLLFIVYLLFLRNCYLALVHDGRNPHNILQARYAPALSSGESQVSVHRLLDYYISLSVPRSRRDRLLDHTFEVVRRSIHPLLLINLQ